MQPQRRLQLSREEHPLPKTRPEMVSKVETLLNGGGVQRLMLEVGKPIIVHRYVDVTDLSIPPAELPQDDLLYAARNADMVPFESFSHQSPTQPISSLYEAFKHLASKRLKARAFLVHNDRQLQDWLGEYAPMTQLFGVEVRHHKGLPEDVLLLLAQRADEIDPQVVAYSIKFNLL